MNVETKTFTVHVPRNGLVDLSEIVAWVTEFLPDDVSDTQRAEYITNNVTLISETRSTRIATLAYQCQRHPRFQVESSERDVLLRYWMELQEVLRPFAHTYPLSGRAAGEVQLSMVREVEDLQNCREICKEIAGELRGVSDFTNVEQMVGRVRELKQTLQEIRDKVK